MVMQVARKASHSKLSAALMLVCASVALAGCSSSSSSVQSLASVGSIEDQRNGFNPQFIYGATQDGEVAIPAFDYTRMDPKYHRQVVRFPSRKPAGSIVVDSSRKFLYYVLPGGKAIRYGIAVGREGYAWHGDAIMKWKQPWPTWTPPAEMIARTPELKEFEDGMPGGSTNPLGARALYLFKDGRDTLFRIHGTNRPYSIGKAASSGCFRMINQDVMDLYSRVKPGTKVFVLAQIEELESGR